MIPYVYIFVGLLLMGFAAYVEINQKKIWENYKKTYKHSKNPILEELRKPNELMKNINTFILWPVIFVVGLITFGLGILLSTGFKEI